MTRAARLLPALAVAAALAAPAGAHADPSLPAGWIAGGPAAILPPATPPGAKSRLTLELTKRPQRSAVTPVPVVLADLDTVEVAPRPTDREIEADDAAPGSPPEDLFVDGTCSRASVSGHATGSIDVGWLSETIAPQAGGGVMLYGVRGEHGGDGKHVYVRASWETVDALPDGTLRYTQTEGRFHLATCKAQVRSRYTAIARPIFGGRAFLFRTRCPACEPRQRERLHAITPGVFGVVDYEHQGVWLAPGLAGGFVVRANAYHAERFAKAFGRPAPALRDGIESVVGLEAAQGLGEAAPTVIAYATEAPPSEL